MHVQFAAALGLSDVGPVGRTVAGTGEAVGLHESLQQQRPVAVASLPAGGQPPAAARQHRGSEIAHLHARQDQEAGVVHHQVQSRFALGNAPADEAVAGSRLPGAGAKADDRQHPALAGDPAAAYSRGSGSGPRTRATTALRADRPAVVPAAPRSLASMIRGCSFRSLRSLGVFITFQIGDQKAQHVSNADVTANH